MVSWWSNGRSAGASEAPRVLHRQLDRTPHVLHHHVSTFLFSDHLKGLMVAKKEGEE